MSVPRHHRRPRPRLKARREALLLTQDALARAMGVDRSTVARWESGESTVSLWNRQALADALQTTTVELAALLDPGAADGVDAAVDIVETSGAASGDVGSGVERVGATCMVGTAHPATFSPVSGVSDDIVEDESEEMRVRRSDFLRLAGLSLSGAVVPGVPLAGMMADALAQPAPQRVTRADIDDLWASARLIHLQNNLRSSGMARAAVSSQLRYAVDLLKADCPAADRAELFSAVGTLSNQVSFLLFDTFDDAGATRQHEFALLCAREADDWHLRALTLSYLALQALRGGEYDLALTRVETALVRSDRLTPLEHSELLARKARILGALRRAEPTRRTVAEADERFATARDGPVLSTFMGYDAAAHHAAETGKALADIAGPGRYPDEAAHRLTTAAAAHGAVMFACSRAACDLWLTTLLLDTGHLDHALTVIEPALDNAMTVRSRRLGLWASRAAAAAAAHPTVPRIVDLRTRLAGLTN